MTQTRGKWEMICTGKHRHVDTGMVVLRGLDDSDGYDRIEWQIWTADPAGDVMARCESVRDTIHEAKAHALYLATRV